MIYGQGSKVVYHNASFMINYKKTPIRKMI